MSGLLESLVTVSSYLNGAPSSSVAAGANGYYYMMMPAGTFSGSNTVLTYINNSNGGPGFRPTTISKAS